MWSIAIIFLLVLVLLWPMITRASVTKKSNSTDIDGQVVQAILESFQNKKPELVPINTVYVNRDGSQLKSRFMFLDGYKGVQYDITSGPDGSVQSFKESSISSLLEGPYKPFRPDSNSSEL